MKNTLYTAIAIALCALALGACKKEMPPVYGDTHGVYIDNDENGAGMLAPGDGDRFKDSITLTFLTTPEETLTVWVRVMTRGRVDFDRDRNFKVEVIDSLPLDNDYMLAAQAEYEIGETVVKAGLQYCDLPITLKRSDRIMDDNVAVQMMFKLVPSDDFPDVGFWHMTGSTLEEYLYFKVKWSNLVQMPSTWGLPTDDNTSYYWKYYFGIWDPVKFTFIANTLQELTPDWIADAPRNGETYRNQAAVLKTVIKNAFANYKASSIADPDTYPPLYWPEDSEDWITFP